MITVQRLSGDSAEYIRGWGSSYWRIMLSQHYSGYLVGQNHLRSLHVRVPRVYLVTPLVTPLAMNYMYATGDFYGNSSRVIISDRTQCNTASR